MKKGHVNFSGVQIYFLLAAQTPAVQKREETSQRTMMTQCKKCFNSHCTHLNNSQTHILIISHMIFMQFYEGKTQGHVSGGLLIAYHVSLHHGDCRECNRKDQTIFAMCRGECIVLRIHFDGCNSKFKGYVQL